MNYSIPELYVRFIEALYFNDMTAELFVEVFALTVVLLFAGAFVLFILLEAFAEARRHWRRAQYPQWSVLQIEPGKRIATVGVVKAIDERDALNEYALSSGFQDLEDYSALALRPDMEFRAIPFGSIPDRLGPIEAAKIAAHHESMEDHMEIYPNA